MKQPKTNRIISSVRSETAGMTAAYMQNLLEPSDTVLQSIGGNYKIYDEILRDDQVKATLNQRVQAVITAPWSVEPASESTADKQAATFVTEQLQRLKFDDLTKKMLYCRFYGYAVAEIVWGVENNHYTFDKILVRDRSRFKFDNNNRLRLMQDGSMDGILCEPPYFWQTSVGASHDDEPYGLGLAHYLYWPVIFKRGGIKFWLKFVERFGQPSILGKFPHGSTQDDIDNLLKAIKSISSETGTVVPEGMDIALVEAARAGNAEYPKLVEVMDKAISKIVLGQTMTTDDGSSLSQAQVHYDVRQDIIDSDAKLICESFNDGAIKWLTELNFPNANPPILSRKTTPDEDLNQKVERDVKIRSLGASPTQDYINETYGEGWTVQGQKPDSNFSEFTEHRFPDQTQLDQALDAITDDELNEQMTPIIEPILNFAQKHGAEKTLAKMDELYDTMDIDELTDQLAQMLFVAENLGFSYGDK